MLQVIDNSSNSRIIQNGAWTLANMIKHMDIHFVGHSVPILCRMIQKENEKDTLIDFLWTLVHLTKEESLVEMIDSSLILSKLVDFLRFSVMLSYLIK